MDKNEHAVALGRKGGASRSPGKQAASRANGRKRKVTNFTLRNGQAATVCIDGITWRDGVVTVFSAIEAKIVIEGTNILIQVQP